MSRRWYVVRSHPHGERLAKENLLAQSFEVFLPMQKHRLKTGFISFRPLFSRYLFVRFDPSVENWRAIASTRGVRELITTASENPVAVPDKIVSDIAEAERDGLLRFVPDEDVPCPWSRGDKVHLRDLPIEAVFQERVDAKRVSVLFSILGRETHQIVHLARVA